MDTHIEVIVIVIFYLFYWLNFCLPVSVGTKKTPLQIAGTHFLTGQIYLVLQAIKVKALNSYYNSTVIITPSFFIISN